MPANKCWELIWQGCTVGRMLEPKFDTWVHFGKWLCTDAEAFGRLCLALRQKGEAEIRCNGRPALLLDAPGAEVTIMFMDDWPETAAFDASLLEDLPPDESADAQSQLCYTESPS